MHLKTPFFRWNYCLKYLPMASLSFYFRPHITYGTRSILVSLLSLYGCNINNSLKFSGKSKNYKCSSKRDTISGLKGECIFQKLLHKRTGQISLTVCINRLGINSKSPDNYLRPWLDLESLQNQWDIENCTVRSVDLS